MAKKSCTIPGCSRPYRQNGWCVMHYTRWRRHGDPLWAPPTTEQRYEAKVDRLTTPDGCHPWTGRRDKDGYGQFAPTHRRVVRAHRWGYEHHVGPVPGGFELMHGCDVPSCQRIHPGHVHVGTHQQNIDDKVLRHRQARGESSGTAKLTDSDVKAIRQSRRGPTALAKVYGVNKSTIANVIHRRSWQHLP